MVWNIFESLGISCPGFVPYKQIFNAMGHRRDRENNSQHLENLK